MMQRGKITGQTALMTTRWRSGDKGDSSPPLIKKMLCASEPAIKVICGYEVIFKRTSQPAEITLDQHKGRYSNVDTPLTTVEVKAETTDLGSLEIKD
jgi:hypothetical protein